MSEGHFQCVNTIRFLEPKKVGSLKTDFATLADEIRSRSKIFLLFYG